MSPERGVARAYRSTQLDHSTRGFSGKTREITFPNPGKEAVLLFRGHFYWHEPMKNADGVTIGHFLEWKLLPESYEKLARENQ